MRWSGDRKDITTSATLISLVYITTVVAIRKPICDSLVMQGALAEAVTGIYAGFASIGSLPTVYKMCMSIGFNPFYKNSQKTIEPWILHKFDKDFYGETLASHIDGAHNS